MSFHWEVPPSQAWQISRYREYILEAVVRLLLSHAPDIEGDMKQNATWVDRTGNARQNLMSRAERMNEWANLYAISFMDYGKYLETRWPVNPEIVGGGKYAIVMPTLQKYYKPIWDDVKLLVE